MDYLVFLTKASAEIAAETIYANMVASIGSPDLLDVTQGQIYDKDELSPGEEVQYGADNRRFPVFGVNAATGIKEQEQGYTIAWSAPQQTLQGDWVIPKPKDELMGGVTGYTVEPYNPNWFPQGIDNG